MVLTLGTGPPSQQDKWALSSNTWFCGATILLSSITTSILDSSNFFKQGSFPIDPCNNTFHLEESLPVPETQLNYLKEHVAQLSSELMATGNQVMMDEESKWTHIREMEVVDYKNQIWQELEPEFKEWQDELLSGLMGQEVDATLCMLLVWLEAEGPSTLKEVETEWHQWKDDKLAKAKTEALCSLSLDYMLVHCGDNVAVLIAEKHEFAKGYWVSQALEECWPSVEAEAQKWTRDQYLNLELTWIWPEVGAEAVAVFPQGITPPNRKVQIVQWHTKQAGTVNAPAWSPQALLLRDTCLPSRAPFPHEQGGVTTGEGAVYPCVPLLRARGSAAMGKEQVMGEREVVACPCAPRFHANGAAQSWGEVMGKGGAMAPLARMGWHGHRERGGRVQQGEGGHVPSCAPLPCEWVAQARGKVGGWGRGAGNAMFALLSLSQVGQRALMCPLSTRTWGHGQGGRVGRVATGRGGGDVPLRCAPFHANRAARIGGKGGEGGAGLCTPSFRADKGAWT
ncbi:hypothetical protein H4582DRAFT_2060151 [Lactarius indigo]|nr:hypothetical protein H4582DRAFT_2060151 [Lactarius indigo]